MAKRKGKESVQETQTVPTSKRKGKSPLHVWIRDELKQAFDDFVAGQRPKTTLTAHLEVAIEEYLERLGALPKDD